MLEMASFIAIIMVIVIVFSIVLTMGGIIYLLLYLINKSKKNIEIQTRKD